MARLLGKGKGYLHVHSFIYLFIYLSLYFDALSQCPNYLVNIINNTLLAVPESSNFLAKEGGMLKLDFSKED